MKFSHVKALVTVNDTGSIRSAAAKLGKTQSALTKQIQQIEHNVGFALFLRTSRGVVPTDAGLSILSRARSVLSEVAHLNEELDWLKGCKSAELRISAAPLASVQILPRAIARFNKRFGEVDITISSDMFGDALRSLREGQHDIVIGPHGQAEGIGDIASEKLLSTEIVVITSRDAPHASARSLAELTGCYWAMMGDTIGAPKKRFEQQFSQHGIEAPRIRLASESRQGLVALVRELGAVCTFPARLLDEMGPDSGIVRIPVREVLNPLTISLVTRAGKSLTPAGDYFADCIRHRAGVLQRAWT